MVINVDVVKAIMKNNYKKVIWTRPETRWASHGQIAFFFQKRGNKDRTHICCKSLGWAVARSEKLIESGDSWFSAKSI